MAKKKKIIDDMDQSWSIECKNCHKIVTKKKRDFWLLRCKIGSYAGLGEYYLCINCRNKLGKEFLIK